ncbi:kinase-like domain, phloem protein 2-like protein [Tanacetum coccineum]
MDPQSFNVFAQTATLELPAEVEVMSYPTNQGSLTSISSHVDSHVSKETKSFLKDLSHLKLSYQDIISATNNFDEENIINIDEMLFKGRLWHSKQFIDIFGKAYRSDSEKDESKMFWMELSMLSSLKHKNLVSLIGFCDGAEGKAIMYKGGPTILEKILNFSVIHCNIRSSKILLDDEWEPKLSGFELSLKNTVARRQHLLLTRDIVKNVYLDPKYKTTGGVTHKSDVYSLGVVLLEVLRGRSAVDDEELGEGLISQLEKSHLDGMVDPHLQKQMDPDIIENILRDNILLLTRERQ